MKPPADRPSRKRKSAGRLAVGLGVGIGLALLAIFTDRPELITIAPQDQRFKKSPTVLIVEDEPGPREALRVVLRPFFNIHTADNAGAALQMLNTQPIDLVTLDQQLPDRDGLEVLHDIKQHHPHVEVVMITGYGSLASARKGLLRGAAGYLPKPFDTTELITLLHQSLAKQQRLALLRTYLRRSTALWGTGQESEMAWKELQTLYGSCRKAVPETVPTPSTADNALPLLSELVEAKDRQLLNHCSRVSHYATLLGRRMNLTEAEQKSLAIGAFLHDIGTLSIEGHDFLAEQTAGIDRVAASTPCQDIGAHIALRLGFPAEVRQIITYHQERYDGVGRLHGLEGDRIPLPARIVHIAHAFDCLTAGVPGRPPAAITDALRHITAEAGTHFDPRLADLLVRAATERNGSAFRPNAGPDPDWHLGLRAAS